MNDMDNKQAALWKDFQRQCTEPGGLPTYEQYVTQRIADLEAALIFYADGIRPLVDADTNTTSFVAPDDGSLGRAALKGQGDADVS